jgi:hypothetical protein
MKNIRNLMLAFAAIAGLAALPLHAETEADESAVQQEEAALDKSATEGNAPRTDQLAKQFGVEPAQVDALRGKTGWGGTTIQLAMAQNLVKTDPTNYPTMNEALAKVEALRAEGKGYGAIAKELGFKLGPVVSAARHARNEMRHDARHQHMHEKHPHRGERPQKMERAPKAERPPKAERAPRPEKPPKP